MIRATLIVASLTIAGTLTNDVEAHLWARKVFKNRSHDFGEVARNSKAEFVFEMENEYATDIRIVDIRASCGCITPKILKKIIKTHETGGILVIYNTDRFQGRRGATLTVTFDQPRFAEVQLKVKGNIRSDVEMDPGMIDFGKVDQGQTDKKNVQVRYRGVRPWNLAGLRGENEYFDLELVRREPNSHVFDIVAYLKPDAPMGFFHTQVTLMPDDPAASQFPLWVQGEILPPVRISPASLYLGDIQPNQTISKKIVVQGKVPFRILSISPSDKQFAYDLSDQAKAIHIVPVWFTAGEQRGDVNQTLEIITDLGEGITATCQARVAVMESDDVK